MHLFRTYHHHQFHRSIKAEFWLYELSVWLHVLGRSVIAVFIPILLLELDYSVREVFIYYLMYHIFDIPFNWLARAYIVKWGARNAIILATVLSLFFFVLLYNLGPAAWLMLVFMALFSGLYDSLYWVAHIYYFLESSKKRHASEKDTSIMYIVRKVGSILAPAIGAVILIFFNEHILIAVSVFFLLLSIVPLFFMNQVSDKPKKPPLKARAFFAKTKTVREYVSLVLYSVHAEVEDVIWPIFIYITFQSIESVAAVPIIVSIVTIIFSYYTGRFSNKKTTRMIAAGGVFIGCIWIARLLFDNTVFYFVSIALVGLFSVFVSLPIDSHIYEKTENIDSLTASTYRNAGIMIPHLVMYITLIAILSMFEVSFVMAALSVFLLFPALYMFKGTIPVKNK